MSKSKLKKLNKDIKYFFDGDGFVEGVARVNREILDELFVELNITKEIDSDKKALKVARSLWAKTDLQRREAILEFFKNLDTIYKQLEPTELEYGLMLKLTSFLYELEATDDEMSKVYKDFRYSSKDAITLERIKDKITKLRNDDKKVFLQNECEIFLKTQDCFEFVVPITYKFFDVELKRKESLVSPISKNSFLQMDVDEAIEIILASKQTLTDKRQKEVELFLAQICLPHRYLSYKDIISSLKQSPLQIKKLPTISVKLVKDIVSKVVKNFSITGTKNCHIRKKLFIKLPFLESDFNYILDCEFHIDSLVELIWFEQDFDFDAILEKLKKQKEEIFFEKFDEIIHQCRAYSSVLDIQDDEIHQAVYEHLLAKVTINLAITKHIKARVLKKFTAQLKDKVEKIQKEKILARSIKDFKSLFPLARAMRRKLTLYIGNTNSGKTYTAMQKLLKADTGYYLAPLRLLALEGYEELKKNNLSCSLITGEEELFDEDATHISSTIEMLNFEVDVDVCVIDEVQMIDDKDRGWAWANAIIGAPASEIIMTGSHSSKDAIVALAEYLGDELEIVEFERKNILEMLPTFTNLEDVESSTAIIAFSRKKVLSLRNKLSKYFSVSVIYGNLSPEVRREEARRFRDGDTQILIATDSIAMGLNLPIKTILFSSVTKFDGVENRELFVSEILQISGRAGRFGLCEKGFVGALNQDAFDVVKSKFYEKAEAVAIPFKVMTNMEHITLIGSILEEESLESILKFFVKYMEFNGPFTTISLSHVIKASKIVDNYKLPLDEKFKLASAPLSLNSTYIVKCYKNYIKLLEDKQPVRYKKPKLKNSVSDSFVELLKIEDMVKEITLYLWLSYRFGEYFVDIKDAKEARSMLNRYIERSLQVIK